VLLGLGLSQIYGILGISHFAHGSVVMLGGYVAYTLIRLWGISLLPALVVAIIFCILLGLIIERFFYRAIIEAPPINIFIVALGLLFIFENSTQMIWGADPIAILAPANITVKIASVSVTLFRIYIFAANLLIMMALIAMIKWTKLGRGIRALAQNRDAAAMVGVNTNHTSAIVFALGSALAGLCGVFITSLLPIEPVFGGTIVIKGFAVMIIGGLGSIPGIIIGGLILGVVEALGAMLISPQYKDAFAFFIIILIMTFKPSGLLGKSSAR
jgi:branched-chain amino acid transport system permease protein